MPRCRDRRRLMRPTVMMLVAALPIACAAPQLPPPSNPFVGTWATKDNDHITFRDDTIVLDQPKGSGTVMTKDVCNGVFGFGYETKSREALTGLIPRQSDLRGKLSEQLVRPDYPVAEMACDQGYNTYVMLGDRDMVAIYRDGDIAGIDHLSRQ